MKKRSNGRSYRLVATSGSAGTPASATTGVPPKYPAGIPDPVNYNYMDILNALRCKESAKTSSINAALNRKAAKITNVFIAQALEEVARAKDARTRAALFLSFAEQARLFAALPVLQAAAAAAEEAVKRAEAEVEALMQEMAGLRLASVVRWRVKTAVLRRAVARSMAASAAEGPRSFPLRGKIEE